MGRAIAFKVSLKRACPDRCKWTALEDNDPTRFRSKAGTAATAEADINVLQIPKRPPQFNVCD